LEDWQAMNVVAHISAYLGNRMKEPFDTGDFFRTKDGKSHPRNSQFPIVLLSAKARQLTELIASLRKSELLYHGFIREMIETSDDEEISDILANELDEDIQYLGVGNLRKQRSGQFNDEEVQLVAMIRTR